MNTPSENPGQPATGAPTIKVIGVGGAGSNVLQQLAKSPSAAGLPLVGLDTDLRVTSQLPESLVIGQKVTRGLGTGGDPDLGRAAAMAQMDDLKILCGGAQIVFLVGALGGGMATGALPLLAQAAKETGALVLSIVTLPFEFEGVRRQRQAQQGLQHLKLSADAVICLPNQGLAQLLDQNSSIVDVFQRANELIGQNILAVWRLMTQPGLIKVDFATLCSITQGRHTESSSATIESSGENRSGEIAEKLLAHPFLSDSKLLKEAEAILVSFAAGTDLTMKEVNRVMEKINAACPNANIVFGVSVDSALAETMSVTLIVSRRNKIVEVPAEEDITERFDRSSEEPSFTEEHRSSRFSAPSPAISDEKKEKLLKQRGRPRQRKKIMMQQGQLPLEIVSRGRFEKSEPTIHHGEDLDVPTYLRKNVSLN